MNPQERIQYPPFTHGRVVCDNCKAVVAQCRCIEGCKVVGTVPQCERCRTSVIPTTTPTADTTPDAPLKPLSDSEIADMFPRMEKLSDKLCQTQAYIMRAVADVGLALVSKAALDSRSVFANDALYEYESEDFAPSYVCTKCYWVGRDLADHEIRCNYAPVDVNEKARKALDSRDERIRSLDDDREVLKQYVATLQSQLREAVRDYLTQLSSANAHIAKLNKESIAKGERHQEAIEGYERDLTERESQLREADLVAADNAQRLVAAIAERDKLREYVHQVASNFDHETDAHKYGTWCFVCGAETLDAKMEKSTE